MSLESVSVSGLGSEGGGGVCELGSALEPIRNSGGAGLDLTCNFEPFLGGRVGVAFDSQPIGLDVADMGVCVCVVAHLSLVFCDACCVVDSVLVVCVTCVCVCCVL